MDDYLDINRANWDERAPAHAVSEGYAVRRLISDPAALSGVVEFDRPLLGDIAGSVSYTHLTLPTSDLV